MRKGWRKQQEKLNAATNKAAEHLDPGSLRRFVYAKLDALYARLPKLDCKGLCYECCGPIKMSAFEAERIWQRTGFNIQKAINARLSVLIAGGKKELATCPLLDLKTKRCSVYDIRPWVCRLWGNIKGMMCPHGCRPKFWVDPFTAVESLDEIEAIDEEHGDFG